LNDEEERFEREAERFSLRWACEDCAHFAVETETCGHGYPVEPHRRAARPVVFCKEWELGG
jgi:hypothetical protein